MNSRVLLLLVVGVIRCGLYAQSKYYKDSFEMVSPIGHMSWINTAKIKGEILYTGSMDKSIILWDIKSKRQLRTLYPSTDIVYDFDLAKNSNLILVTHQQNYVSILSTLEKGQTKKILFEESEYCERAFFCGSDNFLVAIVSDLNSNKKLKIYETNNYSKVREFQISRSNEVQKSFDGNFVLSTVSEYQINVINFRDSSFEIKEFITYYSINNFGLDDFNNSFLLLSDSFVDRYDLNEFNRIEKIDYKRPEIGCNIEYVIPVLKNSLLLIAQSNIFKLTNSNVGLEFLDSFPGDRIFITSNYFDSTILIATDSLYLLDLIKCKISAIFPIDELLEIPQLNSSKDFLLVLSENKVKLYDKKDLNRKCIVFSGFGVRKYKIRLSENGEMCGVLNSLGEIELFSPKGIFDYAVIDNLVNTSYFKVLNRNGILGSINTNQIVQIDPHKSKCSTYFSFKHEIYNWRFFENSQILKVAIASKKLRQDKVYSKKIQRINLKNRFSAETIYVNDNLDLSFLINSDNYSYCNFEFGPIASSRRVLKKSCSNSVSEGMFKIGFTSNSTISFIDENDDYLNTIDAHSGALLGKVKLNEFDEISDVFFDCTDSILLIASDDNSINSYDLLKQRKIKSLIFHKDGVNDIEYFEKNGFLYSVGNDGQLSVYHMPSQRQVYSMYSFGGNSWLVKLPNSPYYMCSKTASKKLHYVTSNLRVIGFEQLDPIYNRPDIVLDSIGKFFGDADQLLISKYRAAWEKRIIGLGLDRTKLLNNEIVVPTADIICTNDSLVNGKTGKFHFRVKANDAKYKLIRYNVFVNEVPIYGSEGVSLANLSTHTWDHWDSITLSYGMNKIQVSVINELGLENFKYPTYINYLTDQFIPSRTFYIGIGVNKFKDSTYNLKYCVKDVNDLATAFASNNDCIDTILFTDERVIKENILALKSYLKNITNVNDKVIISCSSHGMLDDSMNFYLATFDMDFNNPEVHGLRYESLEGLLDGIPARQKLLLLDACNSGANNNLESLQTKVKLSSEIVQPDLLVINKNNKGVFVKKQSDEQEEFQKMNELFINVRNNTGSVIIAAAGGMQSALENINIAGKHIENGAFTFAVLEWLNNNKELKLGINSLKEYVEKRVGEISDGKQNPTSRQETMDVDWIVN